MDEIHLYVTSLDAFFKDARAAARRIDAGDYTPSPARLGFERPEELFWVLTANRWHLLESLRAAGPSSIRALAGRLGRDYRGVHADVTRLLELGLIEKDEKAKIHVPWSRITASLELEHAA